MNCLKCAELERRRAEQHSRACDAVGMELHWKLELTALRARLRDLRDQWTTEAEALKHHVGEQGRRSALYHCASELAALLVDPLTRQEQAE